METLFAALLGQVQAGTLDLQLGALSREGAEVTTLSLDAAAIDYLTAVTFVTTALSRVSACLAFIATRYVAAKAETCFKDCALKPDLEQAMKTVALIVDEVVPFLAKAQTKAIAQQAKVLLFIDVFSLTSWFQGARACLTAVAAFVHGRLDKQLAALASEVQKLTPRYDHIITKEKINVAMVRKILLLAPTRQQLVDKTLALHRMISLSAQFRATWQLPNPAQAKGDEPGDDSQESELSCHLTTLTAGRQAVTVTAACSVVYELKGKEQQEERDKIVAKDRPEILPSLLTALKSIA